jgi:hypothetical protein
MITTVNERYEHFKKLFPTQPSWKYPMWLSEIKRRAIDQNRIDVVQEMTFGDTVIVNHALFTDFVLDQDD